ncbi:hypothetical protein FGLOB1_12132 [Fusarium globosum]|uniref:Uncharacterized protein n=1 Tax=Fusarium globosum TaxID=78864 RepID=A0A8H5XR40_9HYPO|nr:hypothetical protein FGLOB1_12132 [Fusarium globosum]
MKFSIVATLAFATSSLGAAIEPRGRIGVVLMTCPTEGSPVTASQMAIAYSHSCINFYHCEHSVAPILANNEWVGSCINCPGNIPAFSDGCILAPQ